jgi:hypothetical protein
MKNIPNNTKSAPLQTPPPLVKPTTLKTGDPLRGGVVVTGFSGIPKKKLLCNFFGEKIPAGPAFPLLGRAGFCREPGVTPPQLPIKPNPC